MKEILDIINGGDEDEKRPLGGALLGLGIDISKDLLSAHLEKKSQRTQLNNQYNQMSSVVNPYQSGGPLNSDPLKTITDTIVRDNPGIGDIQAAQIAKSISEGNTEFDGLNIDPNLFGDSPVELSRQAPVQSRTPERMGQIGPSFNQSITERIPPSTFGLDTEDPPVKSHKVQKGDTLDKIASKYEVPLNILKVQNDLSSDLIHIGDSLNVSPRLSLEKKKIMEGNYDDAYTVREDKKSRPNYLREYPQDFTEYVNTLKESSSFKLERNHPYYLGLMNEGINQYKSNESDIAPSLAFVQSMKESGEGLGSEISRDLKNPFGIKYTNTISVGKQSKKKYKDKSEGKSSHYQHFDSYEDAVKGYKQFLENNGYLPKGMRMDFMSPSIPKEFKHHKARKSVSIPKDMTPEEFKKFFQDKWNNSTDKQRHKLFGQQFTKGSHKEVIDLLASEFGDHVLESNKLQDKEVIKKGNYEVPHMVPLFVDDQITRLREGETYDLSQHEWFFSELRKRGYASDVGYAVGLQRNMNHPVIQKAIQLERNAFVDGEADQYKRNLTYSPDYTNYVPNSTSVKSIRKFNSDGKTYTIRKGDTGSAIARDFGITLDQLKRMNPKIDSDNIIPGKNLRVKPFGSEGDPSSADEALKNRFSFNTLDFEFDEAVS